MRDKVRRAHFAPCSVVVLPRHLGILGATSSAQQEDSHGEGKDQAAGRLRGSNSLRSRLKTPKRELRLGRHIGEGCLAEAAQRRRRTSPHYLRKAGTSKLEAGGWELKLVADSELGWRPAARCGRCAAGSPAIPREFRICLRNLLTNSQDPQQAGISHLQLRKTPLKPTVFLL